MSAEPRAHRWALAVGIVGAALATFATTRPLAEVARTALPVRLQGGELPVANVVALVGLACWGAVALTRQRVRFATSTLALLSGSALVIVLVARAGPLADELRAGHAGLSAVVRLTEWYWVALGAAAVSAVAGLVAVRRCAAWPTLSSRYDAPYGAADEVGGLELWRALDRGEDPTR